MRGDSLQLSKPKRARFYKALGTTIDVGNDLGTCDRAIGGADRDFSSASLGNMPIDERIGHKSAAQARRTLRSVNFDRNFGAVSAGFSA